MGVGALGPDWGTILPVVLPLVLLELALLAFALWDLTHRTQVKGGNKWVWAIIIVFISLAGPLAYLFLGREEE